MVRICPHPLNKCEYLNWGSVSTLSTQLHPSAQETATMSSVGLAVLLHVQTQTLPQSAMPPVLRRVSVITASCSVAPSVSPRLSVAACTRVAMWKLEAPSGAMTAAPHATHAPLGDVYLPVRRAVPPGSSARWWRVSEVAILSTMPRVWYLVTHILWPLMESATTFRALVRIRWLPSPPITPAWNISVLCCRIMVGIIKSGLLSSW